MRQNVVFIMSLSGTLVVMLYFIMYPLLERYMGVLWRSRFLKMSLLFYLIPFSELKFRFSPILQKLFGYQYNQMKEGVPLILNRTESILINPAGQVILPEHTQKIYIIALLIAFCSFMIIVVQLFQYFKAKYFLIRCEFKTQPSIAFFELFSDIKAQIAVEKEVKVVLLPYIEEPMILGLHSPIMLLPDRYTEWNKDTLCSIIKHELIHIKNKDLIFKFLGLLVMAIHWFNPFCILLFKELSDIAEICCDKQVITGMNENEIKKYGLLLISMATDYSSHNKRKTLLSVSFIGNNAKRMKRRICAMKKKECVSKVFITLAFVLVFNLAFATTIFAFEPAFKMEDSEFESNEQVDWEIFIPGTTLYESIEDFSLGDIVFVEKATGIVYNTIETTPKASCNHNFIDGTKQKHTKNSGGGCRVDYYYTQRCSYCGYTKTGSKYYTGTYDVCPH